MGEWKVGVLSTGTGDLCARLQQFAAADPGQRHRLLESLREFIPRYWGDRDGDGWYDEAIQHAPQKASRLDGLRSLHGPLALALWEVDIQSDEDVAAVVQRLREHERKEAALLTEIWYEEVGGEG